MFFCFYGFFKASGRLVGADKFLACTLSYKVTRWDYTIESIILYVQRHHWFSKLVDFRTFFFFAGSFRIKMKKNGNTRAAARVWQPWLSQGARALGGAREPQRGGPRCPQREPRGKIEKERKRKRKKNIVKGRRKKKKKEKKKKKRRNIILSDHLMSWDEC